MRLCSAALCRFRARCVATAVTHSCAAATPDESATTSASASTTTTVDGTRGLAVAATGSRQVGLFCTTAVMRFNIKQHEMEKRRRRELEKAGVDPDNEDELPWVAPEEQQRLDDDAEQRKAEEEERRRAFLEKRDKEDALRRQKFKDFRARQIALSQDRKKARAAKKEEHRLHREQTYARTDGEAEELTPDAPTETAEAVADTAAGAAGTSSRDSK